jgi:orsellinic acid C2-O-methyltransferase
VTDEATETVTWMLRGAWVTLAIRAACRLRVLDALDAPRTAVEVAELTSTDPPTLSRFLTVLADLDLVRRVDNGRYAVTPNGEVLRQDHPSMLRELALMQSELPNLATWHSLEDAVRTGAGVYEQVNGVDPWAKMSSDPEVLRSFNAAMARRASDQVHAILTGTDLSGARTLVDVGGGRGGMVAGLLRALPGLTGVVADRPGAVEEATASFAAGGLADRARAEACDFFQSVPSGGDVYAIANVLHDWGDDDCVAILRTVRRAIPDGARLLVVEHVLDAPERSPTRQRDIHLVDLHMLVMFGARERTQAEYDALLVRAGFTSSLPGVAGTDWNVLEARPAS